MTAEDLEVVEAGETPPKPKRKRAKMVKVFNASRKQTYFLRNGKIPPQTGGEVPLAMFEDPKFPAWMKRAERGDVI